MSGPIVGIVCRGSASESWEPYQRPHPWHSRAGGGAVHSINNGHHSVGAVFPLRPEADFALIASKKGRDFGAWLGLVPKQLSTGDRTILGSISKRGNRYLRSLFVQAAWVVLVKIGPKHWDRYGLKSWIEAARKRLHHNVLAIALANKLARIAWAVLHKGRAFECVKTNETAYRPA